MRQVWYTWDMEKFPEAPIYNKELIKKYKEKLNELMSNVSEFDSFYAEIFNKAEELRSSYGENVGKYAMYHALSGSTIWGDIPITADDFPGEDSIAKFIDGLEKKYGGA